MRRIVWLEMVILATVAACGKARPVVDPACGSWKGDFDSRLSEACGSCHGDSRQEGSYSVASYVAFLGRGTDETPNAIAGDGSSKVLTVLEGRDVQDYHQGFAALAADLDTWIRSCGMRYTRSSIHSDGLMDPARNDFHGYPILEARGDTAACKKCHGDDFMGGAAEVGCVSCHQKGPEDCSTCHGNPPAAPHSASKKCEDCHAEVMSRYGDGDPARVVWADKALHIDGQVQLAVGASTTCFSCHGDASRQSMSPPVGTHGETSTDAPAVGAHAQHLGGSEWHRALSCAECHVVPSSMLHMNGKVDLTFGTVANAEGARTTLDDKTGTCSNSYCHGATLPGARAGGTVKREPVWTTVNGTFDACGSSCHTNPPGGKHPADTACETCHPSTIDSFKPGDPPSVKWADPALHINGEVDY